MFNGMLDLVIWVSDSNKVMFSLFEMVDIKKRVAVVDTYTQKLINSEYEVIIGGLIGGQEQSQVETSAYGRKLEQQ